MTCRELNQMLLDSYPELQSKFDEEASWQEGLDTGSTVIYEDVFMPYLFKQIDSNNIQEIERAFVFIEKLVGLSDDEYVKQLILICIFENLISYDYEIDYKKWFGPKTKEFAKQYDI